MGSLIGLCFPIAQGGKRPLTEHGFKDASADPAVVANWRKQFPGANVGMPTGAVSGIDVLDLDVKDGRDGRKTLADLEAIHGAITNAPMVSTPSGGLHVYFQHRDGMRNAAERLPGVDVRGDGGYVVTPPSTIGGKAYEWVHGLDPSLLAPPPWPEWLVKALEKAKPVPPVSAASRAPSGQIVVPGLTAYGRKALDGLFGELRSIPAGQRDDRRNKIAYSAGRLVAGGHLHESDALEALVMACADNGLLDDLGEREVRKRMEAGIAAGITAGPRGPTPNAPKIVVSAEGVEAKEDHDEQATDVGNGKRLVRLYGPDIRFCKPVGWLRWTGDRWQRDEVGGIVELAKESAKLLRVEAEALDSDTRKAARKHALGSEKSERIGAAIKMAQTEEGIPIAFDRLDSDPWLLSVSNGVVDLRTGTIKPHDRRDYVTKHAYTQFDPDAPCERWIQFLCETFGEDRDLVAFIQKAIGYSLTGMTTEQVLFLCYGLGANGKSTMLGVFRLLMGEHATNADFSTFLASNKPAGHGPRGDLARLAGVRLVTSTEPDGAARFSESTIKSITGGDPITCAYKFQDEFSYVPQFKLWLAANHKPRIRGTDHAIWRRIRLIPFLNIVTNPDKDLTTKLAAELPGILRWAVEGCMRWQREGLKPPASVLGATAAYRSEQDSLAEFLDDRCHVGPGFTCATSTLYAAYTKWCEDEGDEAQSKRTFGSMLAERGFERDRVGDDRTRVYKGLIVRAR